MGIRDMIVVKVAYAIFSVSPAAGKVELVTVIWAERRVARRRKGRRVDNFIELQFLDLIREDIKNQTDTCR